MEPADVIVLVVAILVVIACPTIAALIAISKFRSGFWWALIGFFYGPIGILAAIVMPDGHWVPKGWVKIACARCSVVQNVAHEDPDVKCWRCHTPLF